MFCEGTKFSHTYIRIRSESLERDLIYQATGSGVYFIGSHAFDEHHETVKEFPIKISDGAKKKMLQWAIDMSGKKYGQLQLLGIAIKRLFKLFGKNIKNPFHNGNSMYVCTELVLEATKELGFDPHIDMDSAGLRETYCHVSTIWLSQLTCCPNS